YPNARRPEYRRIDLASWPQRPISAPETCRLAFPPTNSVVDHLAGVAFGPSENPKALAARRPPARHWTASNPNARVRVHGHIPVHRPGNCRSNISPEHRTVE